MAGNRRHAGGMNSAMTNLKKFDAEIAAEHAAAASGPAPQRLGKEAALRKHERFMEHHLDDGIRLDEAQRLRAAGDNVQEVRWIGQTRSLAKIASHADLEAFVAETGHLTWPASFGSSPWERAWAVAAVLGYVPGVARVEDRNPRLPFQAFDVAMAAAYRDARRAAEGECALQDCRSRRVPRAGVPTMYIYPTEFGELGGQILDHGRSIWRVGRCVDRNAVIDAVTEAGYHDLGITDVPFMEDVIEVERLPRRERVRHGSRRRAGLRTAGRPRPLSGRCGTQRFSAEIKRGSLRWDNSVWQSLCRIYHFDDAQVGTNGWGLAPQRFRQL